MNLQSSPLIIQSMRDLTWYLAHPPMLYIFLDCFILFLPHIFSAFVITSLPSAREAAMTKIKKNSVQSHQYQRTTIYMIPNHLHYIVIQELLLKISLDCISSFAPLLKDYNTTTRRYHCQDYLQQEGDMMQIIKNHLWTYIISVKISTVDSIHHTGCNIKITKTNAKKYFPCWSIPK